MCFADEKFSSVDKASLKQAHAALLTLVLEAAKHDRDAPSIR